MLEEFTCSVCGQQHAGLFADWGAKLPDVVFALSEDERDEKVRFDSDLCQMDGRYFIRGVLEVPFNETQGRFGWGVWAEVDISVFQRYVELYDKDGTSEPIKDGTLANELPPYVGYQSPPLAIQFRDPTTRPSFYLKPEDDSQLALEQKFGISSARHHDIVSQLTPRRCQGNKPY